MNIPLQWIPREPPLPPRGLLAFGPVVHTLVKRLLRMEDHRLHHMKIEWGKEFMAVTAAEEHLPWVEGLIYIGQEQDVPGLFLPTLSKPSVHSHLLAEALSSQGIELPAVLINNPPCRLSLANSRSISRALLNKWEKP